jgi:hypothetical protein
MGVGGLWIGAGLWMLLPPEAPVARRDDWLKGATHALSVVFRNPQSILCGMIAGLLFIPTTIFDMIWGVKFLQEARGLEYAEAVIRSCCSFSTAIRQHFRRTSSDSSPASCRVRRCCRTRSSRRRIRPR